MGASENLVQAQVAVAQYAGIKQPAKTADASEARRTAEEFEAVFLSQVLKSMFAGIKTDGPMGGGNGEEMFRSMLNQEYGKILAKSGGVGIADAVYREILKTQEVDSR